MLCEQKCFVPKLDQGNVDLVCKDQMCGALALHCPEMLKGKLRASATDATLHIWIRREECTTKCRNVTIWDDDVL